MKYLKKLAVILFCILFVTGCGQENNNVEINRVELKSVVEERDVKESDVEGKTSEDDIFSTGRFVQTDISPPNINHAIPVHFTQGENDEYLLSIYDKEQKNPKAFTYIEDIWVEKSNETIVAFLKERSFTDATVFSDFADNWWAFLIENGVNKGYKITKEGTSQEILMPIINDITSIGSCLVSTSGIVGISIVSADGFDFEYLFIDGKTGTIIENKLPLEGAPFQLTGTTAFVIDDMTVNSYDIITGNIIDTYTLPIRLIGGSRFYSNKVRDLFYADSKGIHKINKDGSVVQTMIDDRGFAYADPTIDTMSQRIYERETGGTYLMMGKVQENLQIFEYSFDENLVTNKSDVLSIWALSDSDYLQQGIAFFTQQYPDCEVSLEIGREGHDFTTINTETNEEKLLNYAMIDSDIIRNLNAKLLAGDAPDVLFLDGLSIDSMIQHGMLSELTIELDKSQYHENILESYTIGDKVYAYPTGFHVPIFASSDSSLELISSYSMEDIIPLYNDSTSIVRFLPEREFFETFYYGFYKQIFPEDNKIDEGNLRTFLTQTKEIVASQGDSDSYNNEFCSGLVSNYIGQINETSDLRYLFQTHDNVTIAPLLDGNFVNSGIVSIPTDSINREMAESFIQMLLSEKMTQPNLFQDGFSVIKGEWNKTVESLKGWGATTTTTSQETHDRIISMPFDLEDLVKNLNNGIETDNIIDSIVYENARNVYNDIITVDEAVSEIIKKLNIIFAERN